MGEQSGEDSPDELRDQFIGWQCRLRQLAVRQDGGRPSSGMMPRVSEESPADGAGIGGSGELGNPILLQLVILIVEREPEETTAHLQHLCRKTHDSRDRYNQVLKVLRAGYYQYPNRFSDAMTALFSADSTAAAALLKLGRCVLHFEQYSQAYRVPCAIQPLERNQAAYQATVAHVAAFNPAVPPDALVLAFQPDWPQASSWQTPARR